MAPWPGATATVPRPAGVRRQLLDAAVTALEERGAPLTVLSTAEQNAAAERFFAREEFRRRMIEMTRERSGDGAMEARIAG